MSLDTIDVVLPPPTEPTFYSLKKAIAFAEAITRERVGEEVSSCYGTIIRSTKWCDTAIDLQLENGKTLGFRCMNNDVGIVIDDPITDTQPTLPDRMQLRLGDRTWLCERGGLITAMEGRTLQLVYATQSTFFLYVAGLEILWISILIDSRSNRPFLNWSPTD
jgi:hypothetical protein